MQPYPWQPVCAAPPVPPGKPLSIGGSQGRSEATGRGVMIVTLQALHHRNLRPDEAAVAVQGWGNVGSSAARALAAEGCTVLAVSDQHGGVYNPGGLDLKALDAYMRDARTVVGFPGGSGLSNDELLTLPCTVLVPAALENQITALNAPDVKARIIVEGANGPTTPEADRILYDRGVLVIPDILANAGGVTVSYFEWVQGLQSFLWNEAAVNERMREVLTRAFGAVLHVAEARRGPMRVGGHNLHLHRGH